MTASRARQRLRRIAEERERHERALLATSKPLVSGSLIPRHTRCARPGCRCGNGKLHGPFLYLSQRVDGRTRWHYIGKATQGPLAQAARRHQTFREHASILRRLAREQEQCLAALERALLCNPDALKADRPRRPKHVREEKR